jgi:GNAT superfamily N-acetyltransferase
MWIRHLQVASDYRFRGLGRQLVRAAEHLAEKVGMRTINLMPLSTSRPFWEKMGYVPHAGMTRVLTKELRPQDRIAASA